MTDQNQLQKFFIYGSLYEGFVHFNRIKDFITEIQPATTKASVYRLQVGFPVLLPQGTDLVSGQLVSLTGVDLLFALLDEFHGFNLQDPAKSLYLRQSVEVQVGDAVQTAWAYFLNPAKLPKTAKLIENGDWQLSLKQTPALTEQLTERQSSYVRRLGSSKGREIVPIDLPLYRELMNLEIIVDKGRRLALSKLGHEVFRYLG